MANRPSLSLAAEGGTFRSWSALPRDIEERFRRHRRPRMRDFASYEFLPELHEEDLRTLGHPTPDDPTACRDVEDDGLNRLDLSGGEGTERAFMDDPCVGDAFHAYDPSEWGHDEDLIES